MSDARFEDAGRGAGPLRLRAHDPDDLQVISALVQDAVLPITEMAHDRRQRRFALLLNRVRREDRAAPADAPERVRTVLAIEDVTAIRTMGIDRADTDTILSLLSVNLAPGEDGGGTVTLTFAGDGAVALDVEALEVTLRDVTRPYRAVSGKLPDHGA